ncbi:MAG: hypothetical protein QOF69_191 [Solirubrobacteraceae bacterium]|nr:hypothetical protein [Solirubrobacteraceae bacterium]
MVWAFDGTKDRSEVRDHLGTAAGQVGDRAFVEDDGSAVGIEYLPPLSHHSTGLAAGANAAAGSPAPSARVNVSANSPAEREVPTQREAIKGTGCLIGKWHLARAAASSSLTAGGVGVAPDHHYGRPAASGSSNRATCSTATSCISRRKSAMTARSAALRRLRTRIASCWSWS